ncbi:MAG: hypothetical protein AB7S72_08160 [Draconibacterium sp.]
MNFRSIFFLLTLFIGFTSCDLNGEPEGTGSYLFVEHHIHTHGDLLSGPEPPSLQIDFPTYRFDVDSGILDGIIDFDIDNNLKIIFGSGGCLSGTAGGGCGTGLNGITSIPFKRGSFEILKMDDDGKIVFEYDDEVYALNAGGEWESEVSYNDTVDLDGVKSISRITETDRITNFGFIEKSKIRKWEW